MILLLTLLQVICWLVLVGCYGVAGFAVMVWWARWSGYDDKADRNDFLVVLWWVMLVFWGLVLPALLVGHFIPWKKMAELVREAIEQGGQLGQGQRERNLVRQRQRAEERRRRSINQEPQ